MAATRTIKILTGASLTTGSVYAGQIALADTDIADPWCKAGLAENAKPGVEAEVRMTRLEARPIKASDLAPEPELPSIPEGTDATDRDAGDDEPQEGGTDEHAAEAAQGGKKGKRRK